MTHPDYISPDGTITLYCGDCLAILPGLEAGSVDAVVTDPPYGIGFASMPTKWQRRAGHAKEQWDSSCVDCSWMLGLFGCPIAIWGGNYQLDLPPSRGWLAWVKPDAPPSMGNLELCWTNRDKCAKHIRHSIAATNAERVGHPTQKPLAVMEFTLAYIGDAETILDPFMGSGTTGVACIKTGRKFIGIEKEPKYFDIAVRRIEKAYADQGLFAPA